MFKLTLCWLLAAAALTGCSAAQRAAVDVRTGWADVYATEAPDGPTAIGPRATELEAALRTAMDRKTHAGAEGDARLAQVANWLAERVSVGDSPQLQRRLAVTTRAGVPFPTPAIVSVRFTPGIDSARLTQAVADQVQKLGGTAVYVRYGIAVHATAGEHFAIAVLTAADVDFSAVPRHASVGDALELEGSLTGRLQHPRLAVTMPDGKTENQEASGRSFDFRIALANRGAYAVELLGDGTLGPLVVANFPVYVDAPEPALPVEQAVERVTSPAASEAELFALVNGERAKLGLRPLVLWPALAAVARAHSQDMVEHGYVAHVSPTQGTTENRVDRAGIPWQRLGENVGMASTTMEVHQGLMASPGHREAIVNPAFTHVGIGVALQVQGDGYVPVVTEVFVTPPQK